MFGLGDLNRRKNHLNITMISTMDTRGGAPIAAYRLFKGLEQLKQNPVILVRDKMSRNPHIYKVSFRSPQYTAERKIFQHMRITLIEKDRTALSNTWFSIPYPGYDLSRTKVIVHSDIINLHWVAEFQSVETISNLLNLDIPVVWTLHDENPFTGGCHYTAGCTKFQTDCRDCLQLKDNRYQIPFYNLENKIKLWNKNLTIVTPSKWLAECARKSRVFKDLRVEVIPNSLETDIFKPKAKNLAKRELGLEPQSVVLLFGAHTGNEKRKGFIKLLNAMKYCLNDKNFKNLVNTSSINILTFGPPQKDLKEIDIGIKSVGYVNDINKLSTVYSAADIFILPSLEDNLPNTMLEAMACGTPVVSYEVGGMPDMIQNGVTGYMAPCFDSKKLGQLILTLVFDKNKRDQMSGNCRQLIEKKFKLQDQAGNYLELFNDLLKKRKSRRRRNKSQKVIIKNESDKIILHEWSSVVQKSFFEVYKKSAVNILTKSAAQITALQQLVEKKDAEINQLKNRMNRKENKILKIYGNYIYRIGSFITFLLRKIRGIYRKVVKSR